MEASIWIPQLLLVLSAIQPPWHFTWTTKKNSQLKYFHLVGPSKALFCPLQAMTLLKQGALQACQQATFDLDVHKFLINSGASTHMLSSVGQY